MESDSRKPLLRPWRVIASELCREKTSERIMELSLELDEAFKAQNVPGPEEEEKAG